MSPPLTQSSLDCPRLRVLSLPPDSTTKHFRFSKHPSATVEIETPIEKKVTYNSRRRHSPGPDTKSLHFYLFCT